MNKYLTGAMAAMIAFGPIASEMPAYADPPDHDRDHRGGDRHDDHRGGWDRGDHRGDGDHRSDRGGWDRGDHRGWDRGDHRGWNQGERHWRYYGGNYGYNGYSGRWRSGARYPYWRDHRYYVEDYRVYGLPPPRPGYRYYRDDSGDIVMVAIASGIIGMIIGGALAR